MRYHCGLVGPSRAGNWIARTHSAHSLPDDVKEELAVLLATPGFSIAYLSRHLGVGKQWLLTAIDILDPDSHSEQALENWNSITREDALILAHDRLPHEDIPLIVRVYAAVDWADRRFTFLGLCKHWNINRPSMNGIVRYGPFGGKRLRIPQWFRDRIIG